jgi:hypothetical protein
MKKLTNKQKENIKEVAMSIISIITVFALGLLCAFGLN